MAYLGTETGNSITYEETIYTESNLATQEYFELTTASQNIEKIELLELRFQPSPIVPATDLRVVHFQWKNTSLKNSSGNHVTALSPVPLADGSYRLEPNHPPVVYLNEGLHRQLSVHYFPELRYSNQLYGAKIFTLFVYLRFRITRFDSSTMERIGKFERVILNVPT